MFICYKTNILTSGRAEIRILSDKGNCPSFTGTNAAGEKDLRPGIITPEARSNSCLQKKNVKF